MRAGDLAMKTMKNFSQDDEVDPRKEEEGGEPKKGKVCCSSCGRFRTTR